MRHYAPKTRPDKKVIVAMSLLALVLTAYIVPIRYTYAEKEQKACYKHTADARQNIYVRYASRISGGDLDFLATLDAENSKWTPLRKSPTGDYGICQVNKYYHPDIVNDPRFFTAPFWQIEKCWELYEGGTRFFGFDARYKTINNFTCK